MLSTQNTNLRLPPEFRKNLGATDFRKPVHQILRKNQLNTVCEEAHCPNMAECFSNKTATFMILGDTCTRRCNFCQVKTGRPNAIDPLEPFNLIKAIESMGLDYVVLTSVDRDELKDLGANHWANCIREIKNHFKKNNKNLEKEFKIELLTPDFKAKTDLIDLVLEAQPDIFGHNIETVERLYKKLRPQSSWQKTSEVLSYVSRQDFVTKSGLMLGLGETDSEVLETLEYLKKLGVDIVTLGQYLRPSMWHWTVDRYVEQASYDKFIKFGKELGFKNIFAGPFVRSSYHAKEVAG